MTTKRIVIGVLWTYSSWVMGGLAQFAIGVPAILGLAFGVAGAVFFAIDPLGAVWTKSEPRTDSGERSASVDSGPAVVDASAH